MHLLNPDTVLRPNAIEALVRFLEARPDAGIAGGAFENADASRWAVAFRFPSLIAEIAQGTNMCVVQRLFRRWEVSMAMGDEPRAVDWLAGASMMVRHAVLDAVGGMDEGYFLYFEETEFCHRAKAAGFGVWYVPQRLVMHIAGQSTGVTERNAAPRRLPAYWFASRGRYFAQTGGVAYAALIDIAASLALCIGAVKRTLQRQPPTPAPHFLRDLLSHSLMWRRNRRAQPAARVVPRF